MSKPRKWNHKGDICIGCKENAVRKSGLKGKDGEPLYRKYCRACYRYLYGNGKKRFWARYKKAVCEACGVVPVDPCQLDVHHVDNNSNNNNPKNLQTLCANCHRLEKRTRKFNFDKRIKLLG